MIWRSKQMNLRNGRDGKVSQASCLAGQTWLLYLFIQLPTFYQSIDYSHCIILAFSNLTTSLYAIFERHHMSSRQKRVNHTHHGESRHIIQHDVGEKKNIYIFHRVVKGPSGKVGRLCCCNYDSLPDKMLKSREK